MRYDFTPTRTFHTTRTALIKKTKNKKTKKNRIGSVSKDVEN